MFKRLLIPLVLASMMGVLPMFMGIEDASGQTASSTRFVQPGFSDDSLFSVDSPTALDFTPDGRMLVASQTGQLRVAENDRLLANPALDISGRVCSNSERGLLGVTVDPDFSTNRFIYVYYTAKKNGVCPLQEPNNPNNPVNRVSRFVLSDDDTVDPSSERILLNNIPSPYGNHNGGDINFGKDKNLYVSVGDGVRKELAGNKSVLLGKMLRITRDGGIPSTNPYRGTGTARCNINGQTRSGVKCQEIFASGLRNPFRIAFDPNYASTRFFINDVGANKWEEINLGRAGADYGWDDREGPCVIGSTTACGPAPAGLTNPVYAYNRSYHRPTCSSITGGAFLPNGVWPGAVNSSYLFGDFVCGKIFKLTPTSSGVKVSSFAYNLAGGGPVAMKFGLDKALYYTTYGNGGEVHRITYTP